MSLHAISRPLVAAWAVLVIGVSPVLAGGALKITQVRTDGNYGDSTFYAFPNGRNAIIDGGGSLANSNKLSTFLDATIGAGGTIWYMAMSHSHTDHYNGLQSSLNNYVVMRYYSAFPENDAPAQTSAGNAAYGTYTGILNTEFSTPYTANANCYEIVATANPATTTRVSGPGTFPSDINDKAVGPNIGPGWDPSVDVMVISGDELTAGAASNENSVSYHIWYGSNTAESGGDMTGGTGNLAMEQTTETNYGASGGRIYRNVQLFKVHHHGSGGSNNDAWFTAIAPPDPVQRYAWNCTGDIGNSQTLTDASAARITNSDRTWYRTDLDGNARFAAVGDGNWSTVRQYAYPEGGATTHVAFASYPSTGTLSGAASGTAANLSWTAATGSPVWYYIYRATVAGGIAIPFVANEDAASNFRTGSVPGLYRRLTRVAAAGTTHQDAGLSDGTYYYRIKADEANNYESEYTNEVTVTIAAGPDTTPPATPTGLGVADVPAEGNSIRLSWTANAEGDLKDYGVYRSTAAAQTADAFTRRTYILSPGTTHKEAGLTDNTTYYYKITARDTSSNESAATGDASAYPKPTGDITAPATPTGLGVADVPSDQGTALRLSWTANTEGDLKDYGVYRATFSGALSTKALRTFVAAAGTTHQDASTVPGTTYYYQLVARDTSDNESGGATEVSAYPVDDLVPVAPTGLGAADISTEGASLKLSWAANTEGDLKDYRIYRSTNVGVTLVSSHVVTAILSPGTTHRDAGLVNGTTYYYRLTARDTSNESGLSAEVSAFPEVASATSLVISEAAVSDAGTTSEWIELYNPTDAAISLSGMYMNTGNASTTHRHKDIGVFPSTHSVPARGFYLTGDATTTLANDFEDACTLTNAGGYITLNLANGTTVDALGWGAVNSAEWAATGTTAYVTAPTAGNYFHRKPGSPNGHATDTNDCPADFTLNGPHTMRNSASAPEPDAVAPAVPTGVAVADVPSDEGGALRLTWTANTEGDLKDYGVYRALASGALGSKTLVTRIASGGTTHQDGGLITNTTYYYQLTSRDTTLNESGGSTEVSASPADNIAPAAPGAPTVADAPADEGGALRLNWAANTETDLKDYRIYRSTNLGVTQVSTHIVTAVASPGTTHQDGGLGNGTTYYYRLSARDANLQESALSTEVSSIPYDNITPQPPEVGMSDPGTPATALNFSWAPSASTDIKDYRIYRSTNAGVTLVSSHIVTAVAAPGTTHQDGGLTTGTRYYYIFTARDVNLNESDGSPEENRVPGPPAAPTGLGVVDPGTTVLTLTWTANTELDLTDYRVYRSTNAGVTLVSSHVLTAVAAPGTTHQDAGLTAGTRYHYTITARDVSLNESGGSTEASGVPGAPAIPTGLGAADVAADQGTALDLSWTANTEGDLKDYRVFRSTTGNVTVGSTWTVTLAVIAVGGTTHQDAGLTPVTTYYYKVTARDTNLNESAASTEVNLRPVDNLAPAAPGAPTVADVPSDQGFALRLNWALNTETDVREYGVYRSTTGNVTVGSSWTVRVTLVLSPGTTHQDGSLTNGATYYYKLSARDTSGNESSLSGESSAWPLDNLAPAAPTGVGAADGPADQGGVLRLSWTANTEADLKDYGVYRATFVGAGLQAGPVVRMAAPGTTHQDAGLTNGVTYYYQLTARDASLNESGGSTEASAIPYDNLAPGAPTGLGVADVAGDQGFALQLSWTANTEADLKDYKITRATSNPYFSSVIAATIASPGTTHQDGGLTNGSTYYYVLNARDVSLNEGAESAGLPGAYPQDNLAPAAPTGLGLVDPGTTVLNLTWTASTELDLKDYRVWRATYSPVGIGGAFSPAATIAAPGTTYQDSGLTVGTRFFYRLTARDASLNESGGSSEVSGVPGAPAVPTGLGVADVAGDQGTALNLSWTAKTEIDLKDYRLFRSTTGNVTVGSSWTVTLATLAQPGTTHQDAGLTPVTTYYFKVTARDTSLNESSASTEVNLRPVDNLAPAAPGVPTVADVPSDEGFALRLNWALNTETDVREYGVYRSTNGNVTIGSSWTVLVTLVLSPGTTRQDGGLTNATTYYYKLAARDTSGNESPLSGEASGMPSDNTAPAAPTEPTPTVANGVVNVAWTANTEPDLKDYRIWRSINSGVTLVSSHTLAAIAAPGTTHQDAALTNGTTYYYRLTARDVTGQESPGSAEVSANPFAGADTTPPGAPTGLGVADVAGDQGTALTLSWTANAEGDLKDYRIFRSTNGNVTVGSSWTITLATLAQPGTTHQDAGLTPVTTYYFKVMARDTSLNESAASTEVNLRPVDNLAPAAPGGPTVADVPSDEGFALRLNWALNTETDVREYGVYRSTNGNVTVGSSWTVLTTLVLSPGTTRQDGGLGNGTTYYYKLAARDTSGNESPLSGESSGVPADNTAPAIPAGLAVGDPGTTVLNLTWTANTEGDMKDYRVFRSTNAGVTLVSSHTLVAIAAPGTTHQDGGLTAGVRYNYTVTARDTSGNESAGSSEGSGVPGAPAVPTGLGVADVGGDQGTALNLSWTANTEGDLKDYRIFRSTNGNVTVGSTWTVTLATLAQPGTTHQDTGLTPVTTYYFKVTARDTSLNESAASTEVNLRPADNLAPAAPGGPTVADVPSDQGFALRLNWTLNTETDVREYGVYRSTNGNVTLSSTWTVFLGLVASPGTTHQDGSLTNGATYYYKLSARDTGGNESGLSTEASGLPSDNTAPAAPTGLGVADVAGDEGVALRLSWAANTEADLKEYGVYRATWAGASPAPTPTRIVTPGTTHQDAGLTPVTTYYFRLTARDTTLNESGFSTEVNLRPVDNLAPAAPSAPTAADVPSDEGFAVRLSWALNTETDVREYRLYRSTNAGVTAVSSHVAVTIVSPGTTHQDGGLTNGATFYYRLAARDTSANESGLSAEASAIPSDNTAPAAPTGLGAADVPTDQGFALRLSWAANTEADLKDYGVYRATFVGAGLQAGPVVRMAAPGTTHQDAGLTNGVTYYYQLTARDASLNESGGSTEVSAIPSDNTAPGIPAGLAVGDPGTTVLNLNWTVNTETDVREYVVYRSTNAGVTLVSSHTLVAIASPGTTHQDGGLTAGVRYNYRVTARDTSGNESAGSSEGSGVPGTPATPTGVGVADVAGDQGTALTLSWTANTEGDLKDYRVFRSTNGNVTVGSTWTITLATLAQPGTTHQDTGLTPVTTYYFKVTARDTSLNESSASTEVNLRPVDNLAPAAPGGPTVADVPSDEGFALRLNWALNTEPDVREYGVYRSTTGNVTVGSSWTVLVTLVLSPGTTRQDGGLTNGTTYYYKLSVRDTGGNESGLSTEASGLPSDNTAPAAPAGLGVVDVVADQGFALRLSWTANTEADLKDYGVYRATFVGAGLQAGPVVRMAAPGTTHQDAGLTNGVTYYYQVTARDASLSESGGSTEVSAYSVDNLAPGAPAGLGAADVAGDQGGALRLSWTANTEGDLKDYGVYRATFVGAGLQAGPVVRMAAPGTTHQDAGLTNGVTYYYQLTARDASLNESGGSTEVSAIPYDNLAPAIPGGLGVANPGTESRLTLWWTANTEADLKDYGVYRATFVGAGLQAGPVVRMAAPGTTHQDVGLTDGATYYYRLTARDASVNESGGSGEVSAVPTAVPDTTPPAAPAGLGAADVPSDQGGALRLSWTANTEGDLKDYGVFRATWAGASPAPTPTRISAPGTTSQDVGLANGATYYYRLTARDVSLNESGFSTEASSIPYDNLAPGAPGGFAGGAGANVGNLAWAANTEGDLKDYGVYRATFSPVVVGAPFLVARVAAPGSTHQDAGLTNGAAYYYRLTARDASVNESGGSGEVSVVPTATPDTTPPAAPAGPGVADVPADQGGALRLSWTANTESDLKDYGVYRATISAGADASPTRITAPGTTHQASGLATGTTYYFRLKARDSALNESGYSTEVSGYPADNLAPGAPTGPTVTAGSGQAALSWTANTEADMKDYGVYRATFVGAGLQAGPVVRITVPGTTHQDAGLTNGVTYYYRLTARDASANESGGSGEVAAVPSAAPDTTPPGAPAGPGVADVPADQGGALRLSWTANTEADLKDYGVYRATFVGAGLQAGPQLRILAPGTTHQDAGLANGTTYYYRLTARDTNLNESGGGAESSAYPQDNQASAPPPTPTTPPSPPPTVAVTVTISIPAPTGGTAELKTVLEPGQPTTIDGDTLTLKSTGAAAGYTIEVRIINTKTNVTQVVSVKVDAQGNWSVPTPKLADGTYEIQVRQVDPNGQASVWSPDKPFLVTVDALPDQTTTIPAGPNPFRPGRGVSLAIGFELREAANVSVSIHAADGALVRTLVEEKALGPGKYARSPAGDTGTGWDGTNESGRAVSSGIYLCKIKIGDRVYSRKIILIR